MFGEPAYNKGLELIFDIDRNVPVMAYGDPVRLRQIITNITGNAIKFTESGEIYLHAAMVTGELGQSLLKILIRDTGVGIAKEVQAKVFESFGQADGSTTRKHGGTGLGLSIVTQLTKLMGGSVSLDSELGIGSTFTFTVELVADSHAEPRTTDINSSIFR